MLREAMGGGVYGPVHINVTKVYSPMLLALRGCVACVCVCVCVKFAGKKRYVTLEQPLGQAGLEMKAKCHLQYLLTSHYHGRS